MKSYFLILFLSLVLLTSGCITGGDVFSQLGLDMGPDEPKYNQYEDLDVDVEAIPNVVYEGKSTILYFDLYNSGNTTLEDINVEMTDLVDFTSLGATSEYIIEMEEGDMENWEWKLDLSDEIHSSQRETLRYRVNYKSKASSMYDVIAMTEEEYGRLERQGRTGEINLYYYKTKTPVEIDLSISKPQPLYEGLELYFYVQLINRGSGMPEEEISGTDLVIEYPDFLINPQCNDFTAGGGQMILNTPLKFKNGRTKKATCKFTVGSVDVREKGQFKAEANYIYNYYKTINIEVKPN